MDILVIFIWVIGAMFTIGVMLSDEDKDAEKHGATTTGFTMIILLSALVWPVFLGMWIDGWRIDIMEARDGDM